MDSNPPAALRPRSETTRRVLDALKRSAQRAREKAAQTATPLIIVRDGDVVAEPVQASDQSHQRD